jgi:hypothetical protein
MSAMRDTEARKRDPDAGQEDCLPHTVFQSPNGL